MKIIIAGDGKVGATLTRQLLAEGHDLTLIDSNSNVLETSEEQYDVLTVRGNCASMAVLREAGVAGAQLLIAATSADEINMLCCITAHGMNPQLHTIARIRNPEYLEQTYAMRDVFALSLAVNPEKQAAREIMRLIQYPGFLKRDTFAKSRAEIVELQVEEKSCLCGTPLSALSSAVHCRVLVCAVSRDGHAVAPDGSFVLRAGDRIFVTAGEDNLALMLKNLGVIPHKAKRVLLAGGGRVSYYLAQELQNSGIMAEIIEQDPARCAQLAQLLPNACIIQGDASRQELLESEGLARCDAFVSMTGIDEQNIILSLYGRNCGVPQVITKLGRSENMQLVNELHLGSVVCPKDLCCTTIVRYVRAMQNQVGAAITVHSIADGQAEAMEFLVGDGAHHCGEPLHALHLRPNVLIASISHSGKIEIPNGASSFAQGDTLVAVTSGNTAIRCLNDIFA